MSRYFQKHAGYRTTMLGKVGFNFYDIFVYAFCILFAVLCVYPMWYVLISSITPYEEYVKGGLMLIPTGGIDLEGIPVTLRNWRWHKPGVGHA